jgi:cytochrome c5
MSDASHSHEEEAHEGPIKTPKQLITTIVFSVLVPVFAIVLLATYVTSDKRPAAGSDGLGPEATALRISRVGKVEVKDASNPAALKTGEQVYTAQCSGCHAAGMLGAPKFGDAQAWGPRIAQGYEVLLTSALKGKNSMSAQGGGDYSDVEVGRAVVYMANQGGAKFAEPAAPGAAAPTADAAPAAASAEASAPADAAK